jgi:hypothetical protein
VKYILVFLGTQKHAETYLLGMKTDLERKSFNFVIKTKTVIAVMIAIWEQYNLLL